MYDYIKSVDSTRPVHYEGDAKAKSADTYTYMYPSVERLLKLAATEGMIEGKFTKPIVLCEYAHAMGQGPGNLQGYQDAFQSIPRLQGGFIWEWANHGLWKEEPSGKKFYAYGGDFGDVPNDGTFVMEGLCHSDHTPTPGLIEYKKVIEPVQASVDGERIVIENRYGYIGLQHLTAVYKVEELGSQSRLVASGTIGIPEIAPGSKKTVTLPPQAPRNNIFEVETWLTVSFRRTATLAWADASHEVARFQHRLSTAEATSRAPQSSSPKLRLSTSPTSWTLRDGDFEIVFDRTRGVLSSWTSNCTEILISDAHDNSALTPSFCRAPTDNDRSRDEPYWKRFGLDVMTSQLRSVDLQRKSPSTIEITGNLFLSPPILDWGFEAVVTYNITADEAIFVNVKLTPTGKHPATVPRTTTFRGPHIDTIRRPWPTRIISR